MTTSSDTTRPSAPNRSIDEVLNETEVGAFISKYKTPVIAFFAVLIVSVFSWGVYNHNSTSAQNEKNDIIYDFTKNKLQGFTEDKVKLVELVEAFNLMYDDLKGFEGIVALTLKTSDELVKKGELETARDFLKRVFNDFKSSDPYVSYFLGYRLAVVNEDLKKYDDAIEVLEFLVSQKTNLLEAKLYFDLGRLYKKVGNLENSRANFNYVIDSMNSEEFSKLAKIYLEDL